MRLVVTDTGRIWNHKNPILKKYKDVVLVVCLEGRKVTDEYECFISPYEQGGKNIDRYAIEDPRLQALATVGKFLNAELEYNKELVFLSDNEPTSLYPFYVVKELHEYNRLHLLTISPLIFESEARKRGHKQMLSNLSYLDSFLYYDANEVLRVFDKKKTVDDFFDFVRDDIGRIIPRILNGIHHMRGYPCYFDFSSEEYVPLKDGFGSIDITKKDMKVSEIDFEMEMYDDMTLGFIPVIPYPQKSKGTKSVIEKPIARVDGKKVCNTLREQRIRLAIANNIPFESEECPSIGACAGTCEKCDGEADYLREQMNLIPKEKRVYPQFNSVKEAAR